MTFLRFSSEPGSRHRARRQGAAMVVDETPVTLRDAGGGDFVATVAGRSEHLYSVADGDVIHVQLRGRAYRIERIDPTRSSGAAAAATAGASLAPMPGVVVSVQVRPGQEVRQGDPLLVIESMKLQLTIAAAADGRVAELPFAVGQSFQRGAALVRIAPEGGS